MIAMDGSAGEGGGQILRTAMGLSLVTGKPFHIQRIRAGRAKPGLMRQHLTAVRAAAEVGDARVEGASLGSVELTFVPAKVRPGEYSFDVGTAGSATLVLQTVLPALILANRPSQLCLRGGTHNTHAPPFDFLQKAFLPLLGRMGPKVEAALDRPGFYPAGGGQVTVAIQPCAKLQPIELLQRGRIVRRLARGMVSRLPRHIAEREVETVRRRLSWPPDCTAVEEVESPGPGNVLIVEVQSEQVTEVFSGFGEKGVRARTLPRAWSARSAAILTRKCRWAGIWPISSSSPWRWPEAGVSARWPRPNTPARTSKPCSSSSTCRSPSGRSNRACGKSASAAKPLVRNNLGGCPGSSRSDRGTVPFGNCLKACIAPAPRVPYTSASRRPLPAGQSSRHP